MEGSEMENVELVGVTHVVDAVTFWAQNVSEDQAIESMTNTLSQICPMARRVTGIPSMYKIYAAMFSEDRCWYRCKVQMQEEEKFHVIYIDYGNCEVVSRSSLVELPEDLQMPSFAKKYMFWGFQALGEQDSSHFQQGRTFLYNLIYGKKVRIQAKSVRMDGTVLVQAFQGDVSIGEEVAKMKFSQTSIPRGTQDFQNPPRILRPPSGLWPSGVLEQGHAGDGKQEGHMPGPRQAALHQRPRAFRNVQKSFLVETLRVLNRFFNCDILSHCVGVNAGASTSLSCFSTLRERAAVAAVPPSSLRVKADRELQEENETLRAESRALEQKAVLLEVRLKDISLELQKVKEGFQTELEELEKQMQTAVGDKLRALLEKTEAVRRLRQGSPGSSVGDGLSEAIDAVTRTGLSAPAAMERLDTAWTAYSLAQAALQACAVDKDELRDLIGRRNEARRALVEAIDDFLLEADRLPIAERMDTLKDLGSSLSVVFGSFPSLDVGESAFESFAEWKSQKQQYFSGIRKQTDESLKALRSWLCDTSEFFCLGSEPSSLSVQEVADSVDRILERAESDVSSELQLCLAEQDNEEVKIVSSAYYRVIQKIEQELGLLHTVRDKYLVNMELKKELLQWLDHTPKVDVLLSVKRVIKSLKSQLRWAVVVKASLEDAEEPDEGEILKKSEEIAETRKALFQEINREKEEYEKLCVLAEKGFPELPLLYPEADMLSYKDSNGLVMKSLERDLFDAEPLKEFSSKRPLVCTEFQGHKVVLKGYSVDGTTEARMLECAAQYHTACSRVEFSGLLPLLALFFGKCDPLGYVMVPYVAFGSLRAVQASSPLAPNEVPRVMQGVAAGLQTLHNFNITHGSLHPSNVFVLSREQGVVGDFDFTQAAEQRCLAGAMVAGKLSLAAPEVRRGRAVSSAADMYALGGLLLWLHFPKHDFVMREDGTPDTGGLSLASGLQALLSRLLTSSARLTASEAVADGYFSRPAA
uniref:Serine/threonine kinase 31 n=1 Tax=Lepisosteus oculatus TaxID=7918 RepID=W5N0Z9_LEPOC